MTKLLSIISTLWLAFFPPLISPVATEINTAAALSQKLNQKIAAPLILNFNQAQTLPTLANIPRYLVYNADNGKVYAAKDSATRISPASFTKLMSTQVALDISIPDHLLSVSPTSIDKIPTVLGLKLGEQFPFYDLLRAAIATSANDAAAVIAENAILPYGLKMNTFVELMNEKSKLLNLRNTSFANPEGYDDDKQYSTLEDISQLINNVVKNYPKIVMAGASDREDIILNSTHGGYYLTNWNGLLGVYPGVNGLKIAYTEKAGHSTIVTATRQNVHVVALVSGANSIPERDLAAAALLDAAFLSEHQKPMNLSKRHLQPRYNEWNRLIQQTKRELQILNAKS